MSVSKELPQVVNKTQADIDTAIAAIQATDLPTHIQDFAISCIRLAVWLPKALLEHKIKLSQLRQLIFGFGKTNNKKKSKNDTEQLGTKSKGEEEKNNEEAPVANESASTKASATTHHKTPAPGHGRLPHSAYTNAIEHQLVIPELKAGDLCPMNCGGKVYDLQPGVIVRVVGHNLATVYKYFINKLRCALCIYVFSAKIPGYVGKEKYDAAFKAILVLQKYYIAVPFYCQASFQSLLGFPLPASTQWQLVEEVGGAGLLVFSTLERKAANGERNVFYAIIPKLHCLNS